MEIRKSCFDPLLVFFWVHASSQFSPGTKPAPRTFFTVSSKQAGISARLIERYRVTVDKASGIQNDPNAGSTDPRYIAEIVKRIVTVSVESVESVKIVKGLPNLEEVK